MKFRRSPTGCWGRAIVVAAAAMVCGGGYPTPLKVTRIALRRHHDPAWFHRLRDQTAWETHNWSGYAVTGSKGSVTDVKGSWVVPSVNCSTVPDGYASFWVGIDGWSSSTVEQIGTDSDCVNLMGAKMGVATYYAWSEFYPHSPSLIGSYNETTGACSSDCVSPGDVMSAEVKSSASSAKGPHAGPSFTVTITDETKGWSSTTSSSAPSAQQSSAEWIAETPPGCRTSSGLCPLADFAAAYYGADNTRIPSTSYATVSGDTGPISSFGSSVQEAIMVSYPSGATDMAIPSSLSSDGTSFSVVWNNAGP